MIEHIQSESDKYLCKVYEQAARSSGFDGLTADPMSRGVEAVAEHVADFTLAAIAKGLEVEIDSTAFKKILAAYVKGKQSIDPATFPSPMYRGNIRSIK